MTRHPHQPKTGTPEIDRMLTRLFEHDSGEGHRLNPLPDDLRQGIVEAGPAMTEPLISIVMDEYLASEEAPGDGWLPIHAAKLLAERGDQEAIEPMLDLLSDCHWDEYLYSGLITALSAFGEPAVDPALARLDPPPDNEIQEAFYGALREILARSGVQEDRIYQALMDAFDNDPEYAAGYLSMYGDPRAIEPMSERLDEVSVDAGDTSLMGNQVVIELADAIVALGGTLTQEQKQKLKKVRQSRERARRQSQSLFDQSRETDARPGDEKTYRKSAREELGRNDPCWCGSGRKYKKCHLREDQK